jgi:quinol monooxygenase YgiN
MSERVFVVSEWLPKKNCEEQLWIFLNTIMTLTENEKGCVRAHAYRPTNLPESPVKSKYPFMLLQEYIDIQAFEAHCQEEHTKNAFEQQVPLLVEEWTCRILQDL